MHETAFPRVLERGAVVARERTLGRVALAAGTDFPSSGPTPAIALPSLAATTPFRKLEDFMQLGLEAHFHHRSAHG